MDNGWDPPPVISCLFYSSFPQKPGFARGPPGGLRRQGAAGLWRRCVSAAAEETNATGDAEGAFSEPLADSRPTYDEQQEEQRIALEDLEVGGTYEAKVVG